MSLSPEEKFARLATLRLIPRVGPDMTNPADTLDGLIDLVNLAKPRRVLEIGAHDGVSTEVFLLHADHVTVIDPWANTAAVRKAVKAYSEDDAHFKKFLARCGGYANLTIKRGYSPLAVLELYVDPSAHFDLVYIDAIHDHDAAKTDILASLPLVTNGGWIGGHDHTLNDPGDPNVGVVQAVAEVFTKPDYVFSDTSWLVRVNRG